MSINKIKLVFFIVLMKNSYRKSKYGGVWIILKTMCILIRNGIKKQKLNRIIIMFSISSILKVLLFIILTKI